MATTTNHNSQAKNTINNPINVRSEIPSPVEWVEQHYSIATLIDTLTHLQQLLSHQSLFHGSEDGELVIDANVKDLLRKEYGLEHWEYLEKYLLSNC